MTVVSNYLWPSHFYKKKRFVKITNYKTQNRIKLKKIENFFSSKIGCPVKLFPSGRSCLGIILRYLGTNKDNYIFLNKWSSNSVISSAIKRCREGLEKVDILPEGANLYFNTKFVRPLHTVLKVAK